MVTEKVKRYLKEIEKNNKKGNKINAFLEINKSALKQAQEIDKKIKLKKAGKLAGEVFGIKANICVQGLHASCSSKTLEDYKAPYNATVIDKIQKEDGIILGIVNCDEFACGSSGETSAFGPTKNPYNLELIPGGSSSGSSASVAAGFCDVALGSDTGGSIRNPASHCGVVGFKPTYGTVSRYGLIDMAMSLEGIGPIGKTVYDVAKIMEIIKGVDEKDSITQEIKDFDLKKISQIPTNIKVGILDYETENKEIKQLIEEKIKEVSEKLGWKITKIKLKNIDLAISTYYPIVYTEFFSSTRKFDGRQYGKKIEASCGPEVLRRILGGSEITKAEHKGRYYHLALMARNHIEKETSSAFKKVDCIISATCPKLAHKIGEKISVKEMYEYDVLTVIPNLAGNCAISIPAGKINNIPVGMQIMCDKFKDEKCLKIANAIEKNI